MQYSSRDLRAVDIMALVLAGFGIAAAVLGVLLSRTRWVPCGVVLAGLGFVLNAKLRRIIANGGHEGPGATKPVALPAGHLDEP
jgi:hypothetical protein